jgi:hypothetical protein
MTDKELRQRVDVEAVKKALERYEAAWGKFQQDYRSLLTEHPDQWVVVSAEGLVAAADSLEDAVAKRDELGLETSDAVLEYLDPTPRRYLL